MDALATITDLTDRIAETASRLLDYCRRNDWAGYDPYDALNSRLFARTPMIRSRLCSLAFTQIMKRLPFNLRPLLGISKEQNPKALGLFLASFVKLSRLGLLEDENLINLMIERLEALRSPNVPYWCWGYSFPWQTRNRLVPRGEPNLVCTVFVANALLDAYEKTLESNLLGMAVSAAEYILNELYWTQDGSAGFCYPLPGMRSRVHNANFLGAALLCRVYKLREEGKFLEPALKVARHSAAKQNSNGSWDYGEWPIHRWVDNFHTGYNLCALRTISQHCETTEFDLHTHRGFRFYREHFFSHDAAPRYFQDRIYPIDIHCVAQSIITLLTLGDLEEGNITLAEDVYAWAMEHMYSGHGYFYYQMLPFYTNRLAYTRWSQAWMLLALSALLGATPQYT